MQRISKKVKIGNTFIGAGEPIAVQTMLNIPPDNIKENVAQAKKMENLGCDIIRVAVPNLKDVKIINSLKEAINIPVVADIHFDYKIALECIEAGADKIRINPGNIGSVDRIKQVADECNKKNIPIRIGVNSGSLEKQFLEKYKGPTAQALCESALHHVYLLEQFDFNNIVISIKSSNVYTMVNAYRLVAKKCNYPLHLGVTEAGTENIGILKSAVGIGSLLIDGIGDTIRVSLTANPETEVKTGINLLKAININKNSIKFISCPTCGRTKIDLIKLAKNVEDSLINVNKDITVAIMGCEVNGPGEAREADIGIAGGNKIGIIFKKGKIIKKVPEEKLLYELIKEIEKI